ncbi:MAG: hypothetical protein JWP44_677 [Mucilaginibacter sp.]|nr:hypothetical protein [Mucilaginibacter sp.]
MENLKKAARTAYCIGLAGMVFPQFFYKEFGNNFFPAWPGLPWVAFWVYLFTAVTITACIAIVLEKRGRTVSLILGGLLLAMYCLGDIPYELIIDPYNNHLGSWANGLKELALAGGAFVVAGSFPDKVNVKKSFLIKLLEKLIPFGGIFFSITMILYGYAHFLYTQPISTLVPNWISGHVFWTYFAGAALMCSGIAIVFRIKLNITAMLLGTMIFLWLILIHLPHAIADPRGNNGNEIISAFSALAFSGIAFVIACGSVTKKLINK